MDIEPRIKGIEGLINGLSLQDDKREKVRSYCAIRVLCDEIVRMAKARNCSGWNYLEEKVGDVIFHSAVLAGLENKMGHPATQHASWARIGADSMRGALLMGTDTKQHSSERI